MNPSFAHGDIITIAVHSMNNNRLIDRSRASSTERKKGALMIERLKDLFGFSSYQEIELIAAVEMEDEVENHKKLRWARDKYGNPTYPRRESQRLNS